MYRLSTGHQSLIHEFHLVISASVFCPDILSPLFGTLKESVQVRNSAISAMLTSGHGSVGLSLGQFTSGFRRMNPPAFANPQAYLVFTFLVFN